MQKIYISIISILLSSTVFAQWSVLTSPVAAELRGVYFTSAWTGYVVGAPATAGAAATVIKTTDGGATWSTLVPGTTDTLRSVFFTTADTGFACGANGRIIRTTNAGTTWDTVSSGVNYLLRSVYFPSHSTGYIAGGFGTILKTTDGGSTWSAQTSGITQDLINIRFSDTDTGYVVSSTSTFTSGIILKTVDGGTTWTTANTNAMGFLGLAVVNASNVFAGGGNQTIVQTTNGGTTWQQVYTGVAANNFRGAFFTSPAVGWFVGDLGATFGTTDGGITWANASVTANGLLGIHFPQADTGYACGNAGTIVKYIAPCSPVLPAPGAVTGDTSICSNDTAVYFIHPMTGITSYHWALPANAVIVGSASDTIVTVVFHDSSGYVTASGVNLCGPGAGSSLHVSVIAAPPTPHISNISGSLVSSSTSGNQWNFNGQPIAGAVNNFYIPTQNGSYTVTVTLPPGCSSTSAPYTVSSIGIDEANSFLNINVSPNPFHEFTIITLPENNSGSFHLDVIDISGRIVQTILQTAKKEIVITRTNLEDGIYFFRLLNTEGVLLSKGKLIAN